MVLAGEGDYLVGLGYVGRYGFGEVGVELGDVFFGEEGGDGFLGLVEGGTFGVGFGRGGTLHVLRPMWHSPYPRRAILRFVREGGWRGTHRSSGYRGPAS